MKKHLRLIVCGSFLLSGCGGGSTGGGSPFVSFSPDPLTFNNEVVDTTSPPMTVELANSGTATLSITSIVASANFAQTNNCGPTLAPLANCTINVTFKPSTTGSLSGTLSVTDSAPDSPQTDALSGTGAPVTDQDTLTGYCFSTSGLAPNECSVGRDPTDCPIGEQAMTPTLESGCLPPATVLVDTSRVCQFALSGLDHNLEGVCEATYGGAAALNHSTLRNFAAKQESWNGDFSPTKWAVIRHHPPCGSRSSPD